MAANFIHRVTKNTMVVFIAVFAVSIASVGLFCEQADASEKDTIVIARAMDFNSLDPNRAWCDTCKIYVGATYETLVGLAADNKTIVPKVAESWDASADGKTFTFHLNKNAVFSDGSAVEAKDVKWSLERLKNLKEGPSMFVEGIQKIETPDAHTVVITIDKWGSEFLGQLAVPYVGIINSDVAIANGAVAGPDAASKDTAEGWFLKNSAGSAPFVLDTYRPDEELRLKRNEKYWGAKPAVGHVVIREVKDAVSQAQMIESGMADIATQIDADTAKSIKSDDVVVKSLPSFNFVYVGLAPGAKNNKVPMTPKVREAIGYALDFEGINDVTVGGKGRYQATAIPNGFPGTENLPLPKRDLEKAKRLLAEEGLSGGFEIEAVYPNVNQYGVDFGTMMQKVQQDLKKVGIQIKLQPVTFPVWLDRIKEGTIPMTGLWYAPDYFGSAQYVTYFTMTPGVRWYGRAGGGKELPELLNKREVELLAKAQQASAVEAEKLYHEIGLEMIKDRIIIPTVNPDLLFVYRKNITGVRYDISSELPLSEFGKK
jgi:peptide/nickel transport system substrate-binding protein